MRTRYFLLCVLLPLLGMGCNEPPSEVTPPTKLTVYTYESLNSDYGLLPKVLPQFESEHNVDVQVETFSDAGVMLTQLIAEKDHPKADVVLGIDNQQLQDIADNNLIKSFEATDRGFTPFDYGYVAFVYDSEKISFPNPISLNDLTDPKYKNKIIIEQPGLSSPGTQLLMWVHEVYGDKAAAFWNDLKPNVLTIAPDWNTAYYSMFLNEQAPIVLSYITSPAYHEIEEGTTRYKFIPMTDPYIEQIEGAAVINGSAHINEANQFVEYIVSKPVQDQVATTQWMFPALETASTPTIFANIKPKVGQILPTTFHDTDLTTLISEWNSIFGK